MIILNAVTKTLEIVLGGAITTNQLPFTTSYVDLTASPSLLPGSQDGASNSGTGVTVMAAPSTDTQRKLEFFSISNADTVAATVTLRLNDNSTLRTILKAVLAVGDNLSYISAEGFKIIDANGNIKTTFSPVNLASSVTGILQAENGGTENGFTKFTGPASTEKSFALPNASATILTDNAAVTIAQGGTGAATAIAALSNLGIPGLSMIGPVAFDYASLAAVKIGTTPANGRFFPLAALLTVDTSAGITFGTPVIDFGFTAPNYADWIFQFLNTSFTTVNNFYIYSTIALATPALTCAASTDVYAKMSTAITSGTLTGKVSLFGFCGY